MGACVALLVILLANLIWGQSIKTVSKSGTTFTATRTTDTHGSSIWITDGRGLSATTDTETISESVTSTSDLGETSTVYTSSAVTTNTTTATLEDAMATQTLVPIVATNTTTMTLSDATATQTYVPAPQSPTVPSILTSTVTSVEVSSVFFTETTTESEVETVTESSYYKTVTRTITRQAPHLITEYHAMLDGQDVAITGTVGTYNNTVVYVTPAAQTPVSQISVCWYPDGPQEYNCQSILQGSFTAEETRIISLEYHELRAEFPELDWNVIGRLSVSLQADLEWLDAMKNALICVRRRSAQLTTKSGHQHAQCVHGRTAATPTRTAELQRRGKEATPTVSELMIWASPTGHNELLIPITNYTQMVGSETMVVVANYTPYNYRAAARMDPVPTPGSCVKHSRGYNKTECAWERCMLKHHLPVNITTIMPALVGEPGCQSSAWVTMSSSLTGPHWGQTTGGEYWPAYSTYTVKHGKPMETIAYWTPPGKVKRNVKDRVEDYFSERHGRQTCLDKRSCCEACEWEARHGGAIDPYVWRKFAASAVATTGIIALSALCCFCCLKRRRSRKSTMDSILSHNNANGPIQEVVQTVETVPSAIASTAAGAASGLESAADAGRGTLSRRAEEGRNKVSFAPEAIAGAAAAAGAAGAEAAHGAGEGAQKGGQEVVETVEKAPEAAAQAGQQVVTTTTQGAQEAGHGVQEVVVTPAQQVVSSTTGGAPAASSAPEVAQHDGTFDGLGAGSGFTNDPCGSLRGRKRTKYSPFSL